MTDTMKKCKNIIAKYFKKTKNNDRDMVFIFDYTRKDYTNNRKFPYKHLNDIMSGFYTNPLTEIESVNFRSPDIIIFDDDIPSINEVERRKWNIVNIASL